MSQVAKLQATIAALEEQRATAQGTLDALLAISNVEPGDTVTGQIGKGEKAQTVVGVVLGVQESEKGKQIKVQSGTGFDTTVFVLNPAQVVSVAKPATEADPLNDAGLSPAEQDAQDQADVDAYLAQEQVAL